MIFFFFFWKLDDEFENKFYSDILNFETKQSKSEMANGLFLLLFLNVVNRFKHGSEEAKE